ncbi:spore coat protein U domain-containing protein [uncultured Sphingomonas sp.]|uniref:spore coat protein U domain-containing protein n=1 Tax=uncultured Sphingomonas sp. TaxID=158754 RepID=UPI0035CC24D2
MTGRPCRLRSGAPGWPTVVAALLLMLASASPAMAACTVSQTVTTNVGPYSPAAAKAGAVPALQSRGGLTCPSAAVTPLAGNYMRATLQSDNKFKLIQKGGTNGIAYVASADAAGTYPFTQGSTIDYMQNNLPGTLGLLGGSSADLPFFVKPTGGASIPAGSYTDRITINWSWYLCPGIGALGACIGTPDSGSGTSVITVTLLIAPQAVVMTISSVSTWDPVNAQANPRTIPGGKLRSTIAVSNPDIVPLDAATLSLVVPTPPGLVPALDGDGASTGSAIQLTDGTPASGLTFRYGGPADATDDVDFSADGGATWGYAPVAGDAASQRAITHVRIRPEGAMAKQSGFTVSVPYMVR